MRPPTFRYWFSAILFGPIRLSPALFSSALFATVLFSATACDNGYPIAPTPCDDYCLATEGLNCANDKPEQCVNECEHSISPDHIPECRELFEGALSCLQAAGPDAFHCVRGNSRAREVLCRDEIAPLFACAGWDYETDPTCIDENGDPCGAQPGQEEASSVEADGSSPAPDTADGADPTDGADTADTADGAPAAQ